MVARRKVCAWLPDVLAVTYMLKHSIHVTTREIWQVRGTIRNSMRLINDKFYGIILH